MNIRLSIAILAVVLCVVACGQQPSDTRDNIEPDVTEHTDMSENESAAIENFEVESGLTARILRAGDGSAAKAGDNVEVHYTGWLFDAGAADSRGEKFDSSVDRGERFQFPLGAGKVIRGWEQGIAGMRIGEVRQLTIAPGLAYGERGFPPVIPPNSTLVFEVELFAAGSLSDAPTD